MPRRGALRPRTRSPIRKSSRWTKTPTRRHLNASRTPRKNMIHGAWRVRGSPPKKPSNAARAATCDIFAAESAGLNLGMKLVDQSGMRIAGGSPHVSPLAPQSDRSRGTSARLRSGAGRKPAGAGDRPIGLSFGAGTAQPGQRRQGHVATIVRLRLRSVVRVRSFTEPDPGEGQRIRLHAFGKGPRYRGAGVLCRPRA